jgi:ketosteroid isomerase-like protein
MKQTRTQILEVAKAFDDAIETRDIDRILPFFAEDCVIELLEVTLAGWEGARRWLAWMFSHLDAIHFEPVVIMVEGDTFFEEFIVMGTLKDGRQVTSKQAEVLIYEDLKVKHLRIYFDRLDFADAVASGWLNRSVIRRLKRISTKGLV